MTVLLGIGLFVAAIVGAALWMDATPVQLTQAAGVERFQLRPGVLSTEEFAAHQSTRGYTAVFGPADLVSTTINRLFTILIIVVLVSASLLTAQEARSEAYVLQRVTGLQPKKIVNGMLGAALFRWRVPLMLAIAAIPLLIVSPYQHDQGLTRFNCVFLIESYDDLDTATFLPCADPFDPRLWWRSLNGMSGAVAQVGGVLLAASLGVSVTLAWRRNPAGVMLVAGLLLVVLMVLVLILTLLGPAIGNTFPSCLMCLQCICPSVIVWSPSDAAQSWLQAVIPYGLAWGATLLARRWV